MDLHALIQIEITIQSSHTTIQQLIKIYVAIVTLDSHFQHNLLHLIFVNILWQSYWQWKLSEKVIESFFSQSYTSTSCCCKFDPRDHKNVKVSFKFRNWVVFRHVILFELGNNDQNKQVQHYILHKHNKKYKINWGERRTTIHTLGAVWWSYKAIIHYNVPILACRNYKSQHKCCIKFLVIPVFTNLLACYNF